MVGAEEADRHINESLGGLFSGMLTSTLKGSVWFKVKVLGNDPLQLATQVCIIVGQTCQLLKVGPLVMAFECQQVSLLRAMPRRTLNVKVI